MLTKYTGDQRREDSYGMNGWEEGKCSDGQDLDRSSSFNTYLLGILGQVI